MPETPEPDFPVMQRDHAPGSLVEESELFIMHIRDEEGRWMQFLTPYEDRDAMTRIQVHRLHDPRHEGEKRRVIRRVIQYWIDEVEGDGDGETSAEELVKRNEENTERLLKQDQQPGT